jgi:TolB-like protein
MCNYQPWNKASYVKNHHADTYPDEIERASRVSGHKMSCSSCLRALRLSLWSLGLIAILFGACTPPFHGDRQSNQSTVSSPFETVDSEPYTAVLESSYLAADRLARALLNRQFSPDTPIMAASFVNIDDLTTSSTFGRIVSEQVASRLAQRGFRIIEIKLRQESVFIKKGQGEFMLSRELKDLGSSREIRAALVGTYAISEHFIFVSARIVRTEDSSVLAGCDYEIPNDDITRSIIK